MRVPGIEVTFVAFSSALSPCRTLTTAEAAASRITADAAACAASSGADRAFSICTQGQDTVLGPAVEGATCRWVATFCSRRALRNAACLRATRQGQQKAASRGWIVNRTGHECEVGHKKQRRFNA